MASSLSLAALPPAHAALVVRPLPTATAEERKRILEDVEYNVFAFPAGLLTCDFLSDSGTSAMTDVQWAACNDTPTQDKPGIALTFPSDERR